MVPAPAPSAPRPAPGKTLEKVATPKAHTIAEVSAFLKVDASQVVKTLMVAGEDGGLVALVLRGDHELNAVKAQKIAGVASPLRMARADEIEAAVKCGPGSLGPCNVNVKVVADSAAAALADFVCGANVHGFHLTGVNWGRDTAEPEVADLRNAQPGDPSPDGSGPLDIKRGIEVGHIFQLGTKYSEAMKARVLDDTGANVTMVMGCYGIGVSRIVAAAIEQNHDDKGIVWPVGIAPFECAIAPIGMHKSEKVKAAAEKLYTDLKAAGIDVLFHDGNERPGVMFADLELIGIPHRIVVSDRGIDGGTLEYKARTAETAEALPLAEVVGILKAKIEAER